MGQKEIKLKDLVFSIYGSKQHSRPTTSELLYSQYGKHIYEIYAALNGVLLEPPTTFGRWDISTNNFIIELDEERHFNRYRLITLESSFYSNTNPFSIIDYKKYCLKMEHECLRSAQHGGYWKNNSTERQFGNSQPNGLLNDNGSSRWKQRAYYDFLKDVTSKLIDVPVIRISIYDDYQNSSIEQLLKINNYSAISELIDSKVKKYEFAPERLPDHVLKGIAEGQADFEAGRTISFEEFKSRMKSAR